MASNQRVKEWTILIAAGWGGTEGEEEDDEFSGDGGFFEVGDGGEGEAGKG